ncbi:acetyl-CoA carboxylase biotin carboxylase subunit family protein [Streptomyces sp. NPDC058401]|uniref:ATP-grasp domain-containing protein n=1 Tax=Streptomyces sp. NPDC058401 TaxID=3346480 RepID=UPI00365F4F9F
MSSAGDVLVLSKREAGGVGLIGTQLRRLGLRPVLVSALPDDRYRAYCDEHVLLDWDTESLEDLLLRLKERGIEPVAVVNLVEPLIPWQIALAEQFGLPGASSGLAVLLSKLLVRRQMRESGLSPMRFTGGPAARLTEDELAEGGPTFFPAIAKPSQDSGGSRWVRRVDSPEELAAYQRELTEAGLSAMEIVVEEYLEGTEFSVDGPVLRGGFTPLFVVEKPFHDEQRHHDSGIRVSPPQNARVAAAVGAFGPVLDALCTDLGLDRCWLHVEGRVLRDGTVGLIEINPRPGGGMYQSATIRTCGIDPVGTAVLMALPGFDPGTLGSVRRSTETVGLLDIETTRTGRVRVETPEAELKALPGVLDCYLDEDDFTSAHEENFFAGFLLGGEDLPELQEAERRVRATLRYTVE